jgi:choice-of-anchor B domain-containing protein
MDQLSLTELETGMGNDSWGWTDPITGTEYAIMGTRSATVFVDISNPTNVVIIGKLPTHSGNSTWRDMKTFNDYVFVVSEADDHGMQVFDLNRLRDVTSPPVVFTEDAHYNGFGDAHNIAINEDSGYAYAIGTDTFSGGPHIVDISNPLAPVFAGGYAGSGYSHDAQIVIYSGPDSDYTGREIFFGSNEEIVAIVDVTNKNAPVLIAEMDYSNVGYTHQGWLTEDQQKFILCDELDEVFFGFETKNIIFDLSDLDFPTFDFNYFAETFSTDHNGYVKDDVFYLASYRAGLRVLDISGINDQEITEIGYFDTVPDSDAAGTGAGAWSVYPYFASGNIVISDQDGFYLVAPSTLSNNDQSLDGFAMYPNPAGDQLQITTANQPMSNIAVYSMLGKQLFNIQLNNQTSAQIDVSGLSQGIYMVVIDNKTTKKLIKS